MNIAPAKFDFKRFKKEEKYQQKVDFAQKSASKIAVSPNIGASEFLDVYSQSYLEGYEEKKHKIKKFERVKNAFLGTLALIGVAVMFMILSAISKNKV